MSIKENIPTSCPLIGDDTLIYLSNEQMDDLTCDIINEINHALQRGRDGKSCAPYLIAENIKRIFRDAGYVLLAEDQSVPEMETCPRCDGSGYLYADGLAHYPSDRVPTMRCPVCGGEGGVYPKAESLHAQGWRKVIFGVEKC